MKTNNGYTKTQRSYRDIETNLKFDLYVHPDTHNFRLILDENENNNICAKGTEINGFYICSFTDCEIKINNKRVIKLPYGTFYCLKEGENITHKKFAGFKNFTKV